MTLVNHGFNGSMDEASFAQLMGIEGAEGVDGSAAWAVTQGAGRQVSVAASSGWAAAAGVSSKDDTGAITASLSTPAAGQWYLITRRIDWSAHITSVVAIAHTTTSTTIPTVPPTTYPTYNRTPGTLYDQPLAWAWVRNTDTTMALFDLRKLPLATRMLTLETPTVEPADLDALAALSPADGSFKSVVEGGARFERVSGAWVQITPALFATSTARDTAYAKASGAFKVDNVRAYVTADKVLYRYNGTAAAWKAWESDWIAYTATLAGFAVGTGGSALASTRYRYVGGLVEVAWRFIFGTAGTTFPSTPTFTLPVNQAALAHTFMMLPSAGDIFDLSATRPIESGLITDTTSVSVVRIWYRRVTATDGFDYPVSGSALPFTFAAGDVMQGRATFEPA